MQFNNILISVVIPCYNSSEWIEKAILSVTKQSFKKIEIIIVDDGSTDNTIERINNIECEYPILIVKQKNLGPSIARNNGVLHSNGNWIAFLDSDDEWHPNKLEKQLLSLNINNSKNFSLSDCDLIDNESFFIKCHKNNINSSDSLNNIKKEFYLGNISMITPSILLSRELFDHVGGFDSKLRYKEDNFFILNLLSKGGKLIYTHESLFSVRFHEKSGRNGNVKDELLTSLFEFNEGVSKISPELLIFKKQLNVKIYATIARSYLGKSMANALYWSIKIIKHTPCKKNGYTLLFLSLLPFKKNTYIKIKENFKNVFSKNI
ncbi:glycosyltransferase [Providencia vermicola]|uniref:glycosyltransferase family 2 protein n=1 Tax=Providencia vermicola TaxID=333965 RepID=UPI0032DB630C